MVGKCQQYIKTVFGASPNTVYRWKCPTIYWNSIRGPADQYCKCTPAVLQYFSRTAAALLHCCNTALCHRRTPPALLQYCCSVASVIFLQTYSSTAAVLLQYCSSTAPVLLRKTASLPQNFWNTTQTLLQRLLQCYGAVADNAAAVVLQWYCSSTAPVLLESCSSAAPVLLHCCSSAAPVLLQFYSLLLHK